MLKSICCNVQHHSRFMAMYHSTKHQLLTQRVHFYQFSTHSIPIIDISPLMRKDQFVKEQHIKIEKDIYDACINVGIFTIPIKGTLPSNLITKAYQHKNDFLALPNEIKQKYHFKNVQNARGWTPLYQEPSYQPNVISRVEGYDLARQLPSSYLHEGSSLGPNVWPSKELPSFEKDIYNLYEATTKISNVLFQVFATMLQLPSNTFLKHVTEEAESFMRLLTYPEIDEERHVTKKIFENFELSSNSVDTVGIAAHTDFECFTIIHQTNTGLEVRTCDGVWIEAPVHEDRLFILIGDVLERWTNGVLKATEHRVVDTPHRRQSIVRFNGTDGDTLIEPLTKFITPGNPPKYSRTTQRQHIRDQMNQAEEQLKQAKGG